MLLSVSYEATCGSVSFPRFAGEGRDGGQRAPTNDTLSSLPGMGQRAPTNDTLLSLPGIRQRVPNSAHKKTPASRGFFAENRVTED